MLNKIKNRKQEGFTIIEVLIVLAIAGLILLIVFLAVPALQRNSRNTQRKNDVAAVLGGVSEYVNNHSGNLPADWGNVSGDVKVGFYDTTTEITIEDAAAGNITNDKSSTKVLVLKGAKCDADGENATLSGASARNYAALYAAEKSSGDDGTPICQES